MEGETNTIYSRRSASSSARVAVLGDISNSCSSRTNWIHFLRIWRALLYLWNLSTVMWSANSGWTCVSVLVNLLETHTQHKHHTYTSGLASLTLPVSPCFCAWWNEEKMQQLRMCWANGFLLFVCVNCFVYKRYLNLLRCQMPPCEKASFWNSLCSQLTWLRKRRGQRNTVSSSIKQTSLELLKWWSQQAVQADCP